MDKQYNLMGPSLAIAYKQVEGLLYTEPRPSMQDVSPDTAFQLGWETALYHLREAMGPDPLEIELHTFRMVEEEDLEFPIHPLPETE